MKHPDDPLYIPLGPVLKSEPMPQPEGCSYPVCKCTVMPPKWQTCAVHNGRDPMRSHGVRGTSTAEPRLGHSTPEVCNGCGAIESRGEAHSATCGVEGRKP